MFIQTEETPNPSTLKFIPGRSCEKPGIVIFGVNVVKKIQYSKWRYNG